MRNLLVIQFDIPETCRKCKTMCEALGDDIPNDIKLYLVGLDKIPTTPMFTPRIDNVVNVGSVEAVEAAHNLKKWATTIRKLDAAMRRKTDVGCDL